MNYSILRKVKHQKSYDIPAILSTNVRALTNKVDEIQQIVELNSVSAICITETWLSPNVPDSCVAIPGYNLFCKDRITTGGGVCINLDHKVPCKLLESHAGLVFLQIDQSCSVYCNCPKSHHLIIIPS